MTPLALAADLEAKHKALRDVGSQMEYESAKIEFTFAALDNLPIIITALKASAWRLIETAPKDGTLIDLWYPREGRLVNCCWSSDSKLGECWHIDIGTGVACIRGARQPTHWMLVEPPK